MAGRIAAKRALKIRMSARSRTPDFCPNCGVEVPPNAKACPGCGSDEDTGWSENADAGDLGLPGESFDYEEFVKEEFGDKTRLKPKGVPWFWWLVALFLVLGFVLFAVI